jgi:hypothetical protein
MRAVAVAAGPYTYAILLIKHILTPHASAGVAVLAYILGVFTIASIHFAVVLYKQWRFRDKFHCTQRVSPHLDEKTVEHAVKSDDAKSNEAAIEIVKEASKLRVEATKMVKETSKLRAEAISVSSGLTQTTSTIEAGHEKVENLDPLDDIASLVTNFAFVMITTVLITHVAGMRHAFLTMFVITIVRLHQTLSGGRRSAIFSGPLSLIMLIITGVFRQQQHVIYKIDNENNVLLENGASSNVDDADHTAGGVSQGWCVAAVCFLVGAAAYAHMVWILVHEHLDFPKRVLQTELSEGQRGHSEKLEVQHTWQHTWRISQHLETPKRVLQTELSEGQRGHSEKSEVQHTWRISYTGRIVLCATALHMAVVLVCGLCNPFITDMHQTTESDATLLRSLSLTVLLICTAPINNSCILYTMIGDSSVIVSVVILTHTYRQVGTVVTLATSSIVIITIFCLVVLYGRTAKRRTE